MSCSNKPEKRWQSKSFTKEGENSPSKKGYDVANTNDAELKAVQDEYERETGERPNLKVASVLLDRQREADSYRDEYTVEEAVEDFKADEADKPDPDAKCWECGKPGEFYDDVCYECAAQPFGLLWQLEQESF